MSLKLNSPFPDSIQKNLLLASLMSGTEMKLAFKNWQNEVDFEVDMDWASFRLLPLLYFNLYKEGVKTELISKLKGIYRQTWSNNQILFYKTSQILNLLNKEKIPTIIMKGIALTNLYYKNYGIRPMVDIDILVPYSNATDAIKLLVSNNWELLDRGSLEFNLKYGRSCTLINQDKTELDLHWHSISESHNISLDNYFWDASQEVVIRGVVTRFFCHTDNLFHAIVHGLRCNDVPPIRWIADVITILNSHKTDIDWDRMFYLTQKHRAILQMRDAISYLMENFNVVIDKNFHHSILDAEISSVDKVVYKHAMRYGDVKPRTLYEIIYSINVIYLRQLDSVGLIRKHLGFARYLTSILKGKPYFRLFFVYLFSKKG